MRIRSVYLGPARLYVAGIAALFLVEQDREPCQRALLAQVPRVRNGTAFRSESEGADTGTGAERVFSSFCLFVSGGSVWHTPRRAGQAPESGTISPGASLAGETTRPRCLLGRSHHREGPTYLRRATG